MIHRLGFAEREIAVTAVHRAAGGVHQMLHLLMAATLKNVPKAHHIALHIGRRVLQGVAHPGLSCQMHHCAGAAGRKHLGHGACIGHIELLKTPGRR